MAQCWGADYRIKKLTKDLKRFDSKLYAMRGDNGKILVMREFSHMVPHIVKEGVYIFFPIRSDFMILPLTDNWLMTGNPVPWSNFNVISRLQEIDSWNRDVVGEVREHNEKVQASKDREFSNNAESFFSEHHKSFQKQFSDVRVANMDLKSSDKRFQYDKRTKD